MSNEFIRQRHAAYQTPQALIFDLIRQATGDDAIRADKLMDGYDNEVYAVQTRQRSDYIVRIQQHGGAGYAEETWAINACRAVGVPAPEVCYVGAITLGDQVKPIMVQRRVTGRAIAEVQALLNADELAHVYAQVGAALGKIHSIKVGGFYKLQPGGVWDFPDWASIARANLRDRTAERLSLQEVGFTAGEVELLIGVLVQAPEPIDQQPVLCHGDLGPRHLFVDDGLTLTGVIDFGEFQGGLPTVDFVSFSLACPDVDLRWLQAGYGNPALFDANFANRLFYGKISYLVGYLAHCLRINDQAQSVATTHALRRVLAEADQRC